VVKRPCTLATGIWYNPEWKHSYKGKCMLIVDGNSPTLHQRCY
jgi:hypothetical protein